MSSHEPQSCTKCGCLPEDILMLSCSHDLCLNCASDRLAIELRKNKNANVIVCEDCSQKTPLDADSVDILKSMMKTQQNPQGKSYGQTSKYTDNNIWSKYQQKNKDETYDRTNGKYSYNKTSSLGIDRGIDREKGNPRTLEGSNIGGGASRSYNNQVFQNISSKKTCNQHHDEEILYFCFDCKCQCICPQCVIHGKHKDHNVKTVRKSQPIVKTEVEAYLDRFENNVQSLQIKKSQIQKKIRNMNELNNVSKRQIQQAFDDLRARINSQQKQILVRCDQILQQSLLDLQKLSAQIVKKIDELRSSTLNMNQAIKKDEILFLNFYSRKWRQIQQDSREPDIPIPNIQIPTNQNILSQILDVGDQINRIGSSQKDARYYNQN